MSFLRCFSFLLGIFLIRSVYVFVMRCGYDVNTCSMGCVVWRMIFPYGGQHLYILKERLNTNLMRKAMIVILGDCESLSHRDISLLFQNFGMVLKFEMNRGGKCPNFEIICLDQRLHCSNGQPRRANVQIRAGCIVGREG